jgi:UDP:flavonoid glycosyltransferase YjiC (YdhE family)
MRYVPYNGRSVQPRWLLDPPERPRVAVTCGTTSTALDPSGRSLPKQVIEALDGTGVELVLAISERDRAELGETPPCVRAAGFVPLHLLLPTCDLLIHRGGGTSILTALSYGVPQLLTPQIPDQAFDSYLVGKTGAARVLYGAEAEPGTIRDATRELLSDTRYRDAAARLRAEMAAQPLAEAVVTGLATRIEQGGHR